MRRPWGLAALLIITRPDVDDARYRALGAAPAFAAATRILVQGHGGGSGVLVDRRWVITAAHVVAGRASSDVRVALGSTELAVRCVRVHPDFARARPGLDRTPYDVALLQLNVPADVSPMPLLPEPPRVGEAVVLVGAGVGGPGARDTAGVQRGAENRLDQRGGHWRQRALPGSVLLLDFDDGQPGSPNPLGTATPEPLEGIASGGDSGGGLFVQRGAQWMLAGTFSLSVLDVSAAARQAFGGTVNLYAGVSGYSEWVRAVLGAPDGQASPTPPACEP